MKVVEGNFGKVVEEEPEVPFYEAFTAVVDDMRVSEVQDGQFFLFVLNGDTGQLAGNVDTVGEMLLLLEMAKTSLMGAFYSE